MLFLELFNPQNFYLFFWVKGPMGIIPCEFKGRQSTIKLNLRSSLPAVYHDGWIYETSTAHKHILTSACFFHQGYAYLQGVEKIMKTASNILKSRRYSESILCPSMMFQTVDLENQAFNFIWEFIQLLFNWFSIVYAGIIFGE